MATNGSVKPSSPPAPRRAGAAAGVAAFVAIGLTDGVYGVTWPSMRSTFGLPVGALAFITVALTVGYVTASGASGALSARWSTAGMVWRALACGSAALVIMAVSPALGPLLIGAVLLGVAGGMVDAGVQANATRRHGLRMMGALHAAYGVGAALSPLAAAGVIATGLGWRPVYVGLAVVDGFVLVAIAASARDWSTVDLSSPRAARTAWRSLFRPLAAFFVITGLEAAAAVWLFTYLREGRNVDIAAAGGVVTAFGVAYTLPRVAMAAVGHRTTAVAILRASLIVSVAGFTVSVLGNAAIAITGIILAGLGVGGMYPALMSLTSERVTPEEMASVVGYQVAAATAGAAAGVGLPALIFQELGVARYPATMLVLATVAAILIGPSTRRRKPPLGRPAAALH